MKKIFTLIAALVCAVCVNAKTDVPNFTPSTMTFSSWTWNNLASVGSGSAVDNGDKTADDSGITYYDGSSFEYLVIEYGEATAANLQVVVQYKCAGTVGQYGVEFNSQTEAFSPIPTGGVFGFKLDNNEKSKMYTIAIQDKGSAGTLEVKKAYFANEQEYNEAIAGNVTTYTEITLADLGSGWGESTYDAETKTITIGNDWSGKGWWFGSNPGRDFSDFDFVVVEFSEATATNGKFVIEYNDTNTPNSGDDGLFEAGSTIVKTPLASVKNNVKQMYIQGPAGAKYTLKRVIVCTKAYYDEEIASSISNTLAPAKAENNVRYNLLGVKNGNGVYIMNGKKYLKK